MARTKKPTPKSSKKSIEQSEELDKPLDDTGALKHLLDLRVLRRMAGARSFERGEGYFADERVRALAEQDGTVTATVRGTRDYRVSLWAEDGRIEYACTCPVGDDGAFCKHGVAVGLVWLTPGGASRRGPKKTPRPLVTMDDVRAQIKLQKIIEKILGKDVVVSETEVKDYLAQNSSLMPSDLTSEEASKAAAEQVKQQKIQTQLSAWIETLKKNAKINYFLQF